MTSPSACSFSVSSLALNPMSLEFQINAFPTKQQKYIYLLGIILCVGHWDVKVN